jgi:hypothetical protein
MKWSSVDRSRNTAGWLLLFPGVVTVFQPDYNIPHVDGGDKPTPDKRVVVMSIVRVFPLLLLLLAACGGDDSGGGAPPSIEGPYLMTFGAQTKTFSLKDSEAQISCRPKPALNEFELNATSLGSDGSGSFKFILKDYQPGKTSYEIEYKVEIGKPVHEVEVSIAGEYKYKFFQAFRTDNEDILNSHCNIDLRSEEQGNSTHFDGWMFCVMIWSDTGSKDYSVDILNNYIDLAAKFECDY